MNFGFRLFFVALCWIALPQKAFACVCVGQPEPPTTTQVRRELKEGLGKALAVFVGEPVSMNSFTLRIRVLSVWKGDLGPEVVMSTGAEAVPGGAIRKSSCDFSFALGKTYLIFGHGKTLDTMKAHSCSFTGNPDRQLLDLLDGLAPRRQPSESIRVQPAIAVVGCVRNPGVFRWREDVTVADAIALAGGLARCDSEVYDYKLTSKIFSRRTNGERAERLPSATSRLSPEDELFVAGEILQPPGVTQVRR